jgi:hypothetical protein
LYNEDDDGAVRDKENLYRRKIEMPNGVRSIGMSILPEGLLLVQMNLLYDLPVRNIISVVLVYHIQLFKHGYHGKLNVFAVQQKLECMTSVVSPVSVILYKASSDGIHVALTNYESLPMLML